MARCVSIECVTCLSSVPDALVQAVMLATKSHGSGPVPITFKAEH